MKLDFGLIITPLLALCLITSCAGPTTPLGAVWSFRVPSSLQGDMRPAASLEDFSHSPQIRFWPERQVLHRSNPITVSLHDPYGFKSGYQVRIHYNGLDVTSSFLQQARTSLSDGGKRLSLNVPGIHLLPGTEHRIEIFYVNALGETAHVVYQPPACEPFARRSISSTDEFSPSQEIVQVIDRISREKGFNPAFSAGLIAQESSFNPRTISWARAIGLTQVTPIAEQEMLESVASWPHYPGINDLPVPLLKALVLTGEVNSGNEWRLNSERSINGGLTYLKLLNERWSSPENNIRLMQTFKDPKAAKMQLILASYNSGYARVMASLVRHGDQWLTASELQGVRKYINRIVSFCDSFSNPEVNYENET